MEMVLETSTSLVEMFLETSEGKSLGCDAVFGVGILVADISIDVGSNVFVVEAIWVETFWLVEVCFNSEVVSHGLSADFLMSEEILEVIEAREFRGVIGRAADAAVAISDPNLIQNQYFG